jgi:hypothetical protein
MPLGARSLTPYIQFTYLLGTRNLLIQYTGAQKLQLGLEMYSTPRAGVPLFPPSLASQIINSGISLLKRQRNKLCQIRYHDILIGGNVVDGEIGIRKMEDCWNGFRMGLQEATRRNIQQGSK